MNLPPLSPGFELGLPALAGYTRSGTCTLFFCCDEPVFQEFPVMEPATGQSRATMSAASSFHVYPLRAQAAEAGTLKMGKNLLEIPEPPVRREEAWQSS